jgi:hypothetical protein
MRLALVNIQLLRHLTYLERPLKLGQIATSVPYRLLTLRGCGVSGKEFASFRVV